MKAEFRGGYICLSSSRAISRRLMLNKREDFVVEATSFAKTFCILVSSVFVRVISSLAQSIESTFLLMNGRPKGRKPRGKR